ncbi:F-box/kelch-repeat protein At3g23880-like [Nicotiana tabacum]|uniref:F-box/kelch-repeat protein At3g23880-like n=1 Tax=Nicotiana tabacum TaxID=4097 RepID=A0A1S3YRY0_TOBAC|nr:PREDICTED: F-box/kelch-repeat protein At3g23880-like [Nicotiana tabacum]XP_016454951.1 PREDICTED: F-box/kelch-repeat protein At3g23880-like [Nicotiana tabacum]
MESEAQVSSISMEESSFEIPIELITEILSRLPVKSLLRFRCVSKSWLCLISSPEFAYTHLNIAANSKEYTQHSVILKSCPPDFKLKNCSLSSLLYDSVTEAFDLGYPMKKPWGYVRIVGSVNGLVCLVIERKYFLLWNPSIRKFKKLPDPRGGYYIMYGFGYDELHDDYKVVVISDRLSYNGLDHVGVRIYSLKSNSWRNIRERWSGKLPSMWGAFLNGKLHWTALTRSGIFYIDLADEKWGKMKQPCFGKGDFDIWLCMGVLGSDLSLFCNIPKTRAEMWVMKEYGVEESWTKMFTVNWPDDPVEYAFCPPFCMSNKGEISFWFGSTFMIYNPKDSSIRYREVTNRGVIYEADIYIESLVWPVFTKQTRMQQQRRLKKLR